jgi:muramoyltetrapeptide carboxypeptidase
MLEDVGEAAYRLDRCVMQLIACGVLRAARAVVLGEFTRCTLPRDATFTIADIMRELLEPLGLPVFTGAEFGHGTRNFPWMYGGRASIQEGVIKYARTDKRAYDTGM